MSVSNLDYSFSSKRLTKEEKRKIRDEINAEDAQEAKCAPIQTASPHYKAT